MSWLKRAKWLLRKKNSLNSTNIQSIPFPTPPPSAGIFNQSFLLYSEPPRSCVAVVVFHVSGLGKKKVMAWVSGHRSDNTHQHSNWWNANSMVFLGFLAGNHSSLISRWQWPCQWQCSTSHVLWGKVYYKCSEEGRWMYILPFWENAESSLTLRFIFLLIWAVLWGLSILKMGVNFPLPL